MLRALAVICGVYFATQVWAYEQKMIMIENGDTFFFFVFQLLLFSILLFDFHFFPCFFFRKRALWSPNLPVEHDGYEFFHESSHQRCSKWQLRHNMWHMFSSKWYGITFHFILFFKRVSLLLCSFLHFITYVFFTCTI